MARWATTTATVSAVFPKTPAAEAGLMTGDVIQRINDAQILTLDQAINVSAEERRLGPAADADRAARHARAVRHASAARICSWAR